MAWLPISGTAPQYSTASNGLADDYYIKFYASGTTTPINMATDSTGGTTLAKCALSAEGYPITNPLDDSTKFIPHIDQDYRIVLYMNETDADNNTTASAAFNIDGMILQVTPTGDAADITLRDVTIEQQDDYDRSPLFVSAVDFDFGAGPHVITVPSGWTPTNADMRFYRLDASGIVTALTPTSTSSTTFTLAETLLSTDAIFIGDDTFRSQTDGIAEILEDFSTGWALKVGSVTSESFSVASQDTTPSGVTFSANGKKMYILGQVNKKVFAYDLTIAYDVSTASYSSENFTVSGQDSTPQNVAFSVDGLKMFMVGGTNDSVYEYDLSTAFDVSTAVYNSVSFSVTSQDTAPRAVVFSNSGLKMYILGSTNDRVYEYTLTSVFDISTASYSSNNFSVATQDTAPTDIAFSSDGFKMLMIGQANNKVFSYDLSTAFDVSTAVYNSESFSVSTQDSIPTAMGFSAKGFKMFMLGTVSDKVYSYITNFLRIL